MSMNYAKLYHLLLPGFTGFVLLMSLGACSDKSSSNEKSVQEIKTAEPISNVSIIRNPVSADGSMDTVNVAKFRFETEKYNFGKAKEGDIIYYTFNFENIGKVPLLIKDVRSTCGCTVPDWSEEPIAPGEEGAISVKFDTTNKFSDQSKPIIITANTYPATTRVYLTGYVEPTP